MYHSIDFGDRNTWEDWHLVPASRPVVAPPETKTQYVEIPGASGSLDFTEVLTGYPLYSNRTGSFKFIVINDMYPLVEYHEDWVSVYSEVMNYLHGKRMKMILEDDPDFYYEGRFKVESWDSGEKYSTINIGYDVEPYKWYYKDRSKIFSATTTEATYTFDAKDDYIGIAPVTPKITVIGATGVSVTVTFVNPTLGINVTETFDGSTDGAEHEAPRMVIFGESVTITYKTTSSTATLTFEYREGSF